MPAAGRRDFYVVGRLSAYKNIATVVAAYRLHQRSAAYRGDRLVLVGGGDPECELPADVLWRDGRFRFADLAPDLAAAKASLCVYSAGSQSGVQVTSMQCGVQCLVSDIGGLHEYLPQGEHALPADRPDLLAEALGRLAEPTAAERGGARAAQFYQQVCSIAASTDALATALTSTITPSSAGSVQLQAD